MIRSGKEILEKVKQIKSLKDDTALGELFGVRRNTISTWRKRGVPYDQIVALCDKEKIPIAQLIPTEQFSTAEPPRHPAATLMPLPDASPPGVDPTVQAMADIKEIFDSGDPILVPAIQANLNAFKRALLRERQFTQVIEENKEIKKWITEIKTELNSLKTKNLELSREVNRLKATYEGDDGDGGQLVNGDSNK